MRKRKVTSARRPERRNRSRRNTGGNTSYGASDGSCYPAQGERVALTGFAAIKWTNGPDGWDRTMRRGPLRNGDFRGHEAYQSSTGEAAGLLAQLRMHTEDHVDRAHSQQVDCTL